MQENFGLIFGFLNPKDPAILKILRRNYGHINSLRWWHKNTMVVKHYGRVSETPCFPGDLHK